MNRRLSFVLAAVCWGLAGAASIDPLTAPIAPRQAAGFMGERAPTRVHGNTWLVGTASMNVALIDTGAGLILVDAGLPQTVPQVEANIRAAGFSIRDVKLILSTEPHYDHAGGLAALSRDSGAPVLAGVAAAPVLRAGRSGDEDPQQRTLFAYPAVAKVRAMKHGEQIRLGKVVITAHATPGHTPGSTSWSWRSCADGDCKAAVFVASLTSPTDGTYRYSDHPDVVARFRQSIAAVRALPCDVMLVGHPSHVAGAPPESGVCAWLADKQEAALDQRLASELSRK